MLTARTWKHIIPVALNKISAQKQKDQKGNNGFSQAVVLPQKGLHTKSKTPKTMTTRRLVPSQKRVVFYLTDDTFNIAQAITARYYSHDAHTVLARGYGGRVATSIRTSIYYMNHHA